MNIEIETPRNGVTEELINYITYGLVTFCHTLNKISRAEIILKEDETTFTPVNKICSIRLLGSGGNLAVLTRTNDFEKSVRKAICELYRIAEQAEVRSTTRAKAIDASKILSTNN